MPVIREPSREIPIVDEVDAAIRRSMLLMQMHQMITLGRAELLGQNIFRFEILMNAPIL